MIPYNKEFIIDKIKEYEDKIDSGAIGGFEILKRDSLNGKVEGYLYTKYDNITGPIPELIGENKRVWMRLSPKEIEGSYEFIKFATGKVGVVGLGLGYVAQELAKKQDVEKVVVYEISKDVVELYKRNFGENEKIEIIVGDAFNASKDSFDFFYTDIYEYKLSMQVVEDYIKLNKLHDIKEYSFFGMEHFLLSCKYDEIVWVYVPETWMAMCKDLSEALDQSGYIKFYEQLDEELVSKVLAGFKEVLNQGME